MWESPPPPPYGYGPQYGGQYGPPYGPPYGYGPPHGPPYEQPYWQEPPDSDGFAPVGPQQASRSKTKLLVLLASTVLAMLLAAGGVYYMSAGEGGGSEAAGAAPPEGGSGKGGSAGGGEGGGAKRGGFEGTWESGRKELTISGKVRSGDDAGKNAVSYADPRDEGVCFGTGDERKSGLVFRMALKCEGGRAGRYIQADSTRKNDELTVEWDEGDRETLKRERG